jgi:hypothetical protein
MAYGGHALTIARGPLTREASISERLRINPFEYLVDVLARVQDHPARAIDELLPGAWAAAG